MDIKYQKNLINKLKKHTGKSFLANTDTERIPSNTPLACTPRKLKSNTHTKQTQEPGGSRGPHVGPSGDAPRYVSPMARSYFCKPKPDLGELIARLRCPFLPVVYVPSGRVLPLPRSPPARLSPSPGHLRHRIFRRRIVLAPSAKTHSHTPFMPTYRPRGFARTAVGV